MHDEEHALLRFRFYVLAASLTLTFVGSGSLYLISVTLKDLASEFGWPREVPSLAFSLQFIGGGIGGIVMGYLLDRIGAVMLPLVAASAIATGAVLTTLVDDKIQLYAVYLILFGLLGQGSLYAPLMANISKWYERRRGMAVGIVAGGQSLAGIVWPPVFGYAIELIGWRNGYLGFGAIVASVMLPLCLILVRKPPSYEALLAAEALDATDRKGRARRGPRKSEITLTPRGLQIALCCAILGCCIAMSLPLAHLVAYATDTGLPLIDAVEVLSATLMAAFTSRVLIVGILSDRVGGLWALFCFSSLQAASLALLTVAHSVTLLYVVGIAFGLGYGGVFPVYAVIVREYMPAREAGRRTGIVFLFGACAMGLGSWMGGALFDATGSYTLPFLLGVAANLGNLAIVYEKRAQWQSKAMIGLAWLALILAAVHPPHGTGVVVCWFKFCTGLPCPGCGLTRSLSCGLRGMWLDSLQYHPMGLPILAVFGLVAAASLLPKPLRDWSARCMESRAVLFNSLYLVFVLAFVGFGAVRALLQLFHTFLLN